MADAPRPAVKICGVTRAEDAREAERAGASWVGVVLVPSSPRAVEARRAREIMEGVSLPLVIVVADLEPGRVARAAEESGASVVQLHGDEGPEAVAALRAAREVEIWKAVRIRQAAQLGEAIHRYAPVVDGILVEGWHPTLRGGTGTRFPWEEAAPFRDRLPAGIRFVGAGGLTPENVADAVRLLRPDVVDVSSGVEAPGRPGIKDAAKIRSFVEAARAGGVAK